MSAAECRLPSCSGSWHDDDICDLVLADLATDGAALIAEVSVGDTESAELVVWEGDGGSNLLRTHDAADGHAFAEQLRRLAAAVDKGAALLAADSLSAAKPEPVDHAARFAALDADLLFDLENQAGDCDAPTAHIESLLIVLAEWRPRILALLADGPAWSIPEVAAYERALSRTREAWLLWNFRWVGGPDLPESFDVPEPVERVNPTRSNVARITSAGRRTLTVRQGVAA
jgi:hypothetical protein